MKSTEKKDFSLSDKIIWPTKTSFRYPGTWPNLG